jgi:hypothetical protein
VAGPVSPLGAIGPFDLAIGRFNADARRDLVIPGWADFEQDGVVAGAGCFLGAPGDLFTAVAPVTVGVPERATGARVLPGHFDADATLDFVVVAGRYYGVLLGNGDGTFAPASATMKVLPFGLVASDAEIIDASYDFYDDLVVGTTTGDLAMLLCDGAGGFLVFDVLHPAPGHRILDVVVERMDGDGFDDVVALDDASGITVMLGDGGSSLQFGSSIVGGLPGEAKGILIGHFDYSPGIDLAVMRGPLATPTPHVNVTVVTGDGAGGFGMITGSVDLPRASLGDVARAELIWRGSELLDFVVAAGDVPYTDAWTLYLIRMDQSGSGVPTAEEIPVRRPTEFFKATDMDGDWLSDLVVVQAGDLAAGELPWQKYAQVLYGTIYYPH